MVLLFAHDGFVLSECLHYKRVEYGLSYGCDGGLLGLNGENFLHSLLSLFLTLPYRKRQRPFKNTCENIFLRVKVAEIAHAALAHSADNASACCKTVCTAES
jgi:hypothetical protein